MAMNSGNNPSLVKTALDEVFRSEFDYPVEPGVATAENPILFKQKTVDRKSWVTEEWQGPGKWTEQQEEEERVLATVKTGNQKTHTVQNWKQTIPIPQEFFEDDQHDTVDRAIQDSARNGRNTRDQKAFDNSYGDGFSGVTTSDGAAFFSNSHTALNGDTIDNLETGSLTPDNLEIMFRVLSLQKDQNGNLGGHNPVALLVPYNLFPDANEFTKSTLKPNTTDNNLNFVSAIYPGLQVLTNPFLHSTYLTANSNANTSYYMVSRNHSVFRYVRIPIQTDLVPPATDLQDRWFFKARYREKVSVISWEGAVASNGTA